jgi:hypothetical protein
LPCLVDYFSLLQAAHDANKRTPHKFKRFHSYKTQQTTHLRFIWRAVDLCGGNLPLRLLQMNVTWGEA